MRPPFNEETRRLLHVKYAAAAVEECLFSLREAVGRARAVGVSWSQIGEALDLSARAAREYYDSDPADPACGPRSGTTSTLPRREGCS